MIDIDKHLISYHDGGNDYRYAFSKEEVAEIKQALEFYESALKNEDGYISDMCEKKVYNNGWIPRSERLPEECVPVNVTWINRNPESYYAKIKDVPFSSTAVYYNSKWYWYSSTCVDYLSENGKNDFDLVDKDIDIIAWMELPSAYIPKEK